MNSNDIIDRIARDKVVEEMVDNFGVIPCYRDDLIQEIYLILLQYNSQAIIEMDERGELNYFISRVINNQYNSKTSPFFRDYKKYNKKKDGNQTDPQVLEGDDE